MQARGSPSSWREEEVPKMVCISYPRNQPQQGSILAAWYGYQLLLWSTGWWSLDIPWIANQQVANDRRCTMFTLTWMSQRCQRLSRMLFWGLLIVVIPWGASKATGNLWKTKPCTGSFDQSRLVFAGINSDAHLLSTHIHHAFLTINQHWLPWTIYH